MALSAGCVLAIGLCVGGCETEVRLGQPDARGAGGGIISEGGGNEPMLTAGAGGEGTTAVEACPSGSLFCSGFEVPWEQEWTGAQISGIAAEIDLVETPSRSGSGALRSRVGSNGDNARLEWLFDEHVFSGIVAVRGYFFVPSESVYSGTIIALELNDTNADGMNKTSINFDVNDTVRLVTTTGLEPAIASSEPATYQRDAWNCAVLRVEAAEQGSIEVELDGSVVIQVAGNTLPADGWGRLLVGALSSSDESGLEFFWDDVVVAQQELTCP